MVPFINPPIYCPPSSSSFWNFTLRLMGLGPFGFANEENPFPLLTHIFFPTTLTQVGYHPTGMKPLDLLKPGLLTSKTAKELLSALAMNKVFSSALNANPLEVLP